MRPSRHAAGPQVRRGGAPWSASVGALLALADIRPGSAAHALVVTILLIPSPFVAAILLERGLRRDRFHRPAKRIGPIAVFLLAPAAVVVAALGSVVAVVRLTGAATGATGPVEPSPAPLTLLALLALGLSAGWTVAGVVALGEEYGWRGLL